LDESDAGSTDVATEVDVTRVDVAADAVEVGPVAAAAGAADAVVEVGSGVDAVADGPVEE
jgi:hypothetical protein